MLDFLVQLVPFLPDQETAGGLLKLVTTSEVLQNKDTAVQKKAYRALVRMCETSGSVGERCIRENIEQIVEELIEKNHNVAASAKKDRIVLLATIIPILPADKLHVIPSIIPEAVLSTKEANEATRAAAYDLLVGMAEKMAKGGVIKRSLIHGSQDMEEDAEAEEDGGQQEVEATIEEYITMVAAGLVGTSPHMISATITGLSRLLFEYHGKPIFADYRHGCSILTFFGHRTTTLSYHQRYAVHDAGFPWLSQPRNRQVGHWFRQGCCRCAGAGRYSTSPCRSGTCSFRLVSRARKSLQGQYSAHLGAHAAQVRLR